MRYIADDFIEEANRQFIELKEFNSEETKCFRNEIMETFCKNGEGALWELISVDSSGIHAPENKMLFNELDIEKEIVVFFEKDTDETIFRLKNINDLMKIVNELFGFIFYISNDSKDFLLCWNDHEFIIGSGKAKKWVENLIQKYST